MPDHSIAFLRTVGTDQTVSDAQFGANALHGVNLGASSDFAPFPAFEAALQEYDIYALRYPGGHAEYSIDVTYMPVGSIRSVVRAFLDW